MKRALSLMIVGWTISANASSPKQELGPLGPAVIHLVKAGASTVTTVPADQEGHRTWVAWTEESADTRSVRLALLQRNGRDVVPTWSTSYPAGYAPMLSSPAGWTYASSAVLLVRYQLGAAFTHANLYGIDERGLPVSLGEIEGALVETFEIGGTDKLRVYDSADLRGPPKCFGWQAHAHKPIGAPCLP